MRRMSRPTPSNSLCAAAPIHFAKMHGAGNDFMVLDARESGYIPDAATARAWGDRRTGIGFDQLMLVLPAPSDEYAAAYRVFNTDGSVAQQCGNGARCVAAVVAATAGLTGEFALHSPVGKVRCRMRGQLVSVNMGIPQFEPAQIPFDGGPRAPVYDYPLGEHQLQFGAVSIGNPHAVLQVPQVDEAPVGSLGRALQSSPAFPQGVNVGFMQVLSQGHIRLRVNERGVGETAACGTGACAAAVVGQDQGLLGEEVKIDLPGGQLMVSWRGQGSAVWLTGPAVHVYEGIIQA